DARCDLIVTIGAEMGEATTASARRHPDVDFIGIDQHHGEVLPNLAGLVFPEDRAGFLVGVLAASATVSEIVAVVLDSSTDPSSVAYGTGFTNGVAHVDPDVEVLSIVHPDE
ncbi:MAG: BMP family ABC transporter substrate-binding protein, partial [Acidimicrobiales bacterium]|nr:BMP family ABC transporter substrate-binding protein [Acidimicrobiales bacterium]